MNKKKVLFTGLGLLIALSGIFLAAFNQYQEEKDLTPSETITTVHELAKNGDIEGTKEYMDDDILKVFEKGTYWGGTYSDFILDYAEKTKFVTPIGKSLVLTGESATIDVLITYTDLSEETKKYVLVKENGIWKIAN
ncbi:DUF4878 domain-containing protein [Peribacillus frigoritolerans]|uniref:DUF4878 domain-containing protein n=1 Tax=Peribacillus frigoritolerans TaxID=450367 RepID=UPI00207A502E|nr:DUF4878 domain-containing protein [Peribacillus frigoritolerans]USK77696.1 DUF4878 domain-containing protein [Peribacillus frigoritolerans]